MLVFVLVVKCKSSFDVQCSLVNMNVESSIIYCDRCHPSALVNRNTPSLNGDYYFTKCGKIFCKTCISLRTECSNCGPNCASKLIDKHLNLEMGIYFRDYTHLSKSLNSVYLFQMKRYRQSIQYLLKANYKVKKSLAERTAIQLRIDEKDREIEQLERQLSELEREQRDFQQQQTHRLVNLSEAPNDSFMATFMHHVDKQLSNHQPASNMDHHFLNHQELDFNVDAVDSAFRRRTMEFNSNQQQSNLPAPPLSSAGLHMYNSPSIRSRGSDKSSTIGLAYPIRRDQQKSQQQQPRIETSQHSHDMRTTFIQASQWNRSRLSFDYRKG